MCINRRTRLTGGLVALLLVLTLFINQLPGNLSVVDLVLLTLAVGILARIPTISVQILKRFSAPTLIWMAFVTTGIISVLAWGGNAISIFKDGFSFLFFLVPLILLGTKDNADAITFLARLLPWIAVLGATPVLLDSSPWRSTGTFANPNHTGSWLATVAILLLITSDQRRWLVTNSGVVLLTAALLATQSFGNVVAFVGAFAYWTLARTLKTLTKEPTTRRSGLRMAVASCTLAAGLTVLLLFPRVANYAMTALSAQINTTRLEESYEYRTELYGSAWNLVLDQPLGIGPDNFKLHIESYSREAHNDMLEIALEYSLLGLALAIIFTLLIWRTASTRAHVVLVFIAISALTHSVINFRHVWIALAIAVAADSVRGSLAKLDSPHKTLDQVQPDVQLEKRSENAK